MMAMPADRAAGISVDGWDPGLRESANGLASPAIVPPAYPISFAAATASEPPGPALAPRVPEIIPRGALMQGCPPGCNGEERVRGFLPRARP